ncbi:MAG: peptide chain release factor N(5)-glutamine methyltransferase [bacterium]|nr:peptide chain release factor N(5)-glutamine methyltransferase [bacterium]
MKKIVKLLVDSGIDENEAKCEVNILAEHFCNYTANDYVRGIPLTDEQIDLIRSKVEYRIKNKVPVQYITGKAWFMGDYYKVSPDVLIPRDETELLANLAIEIVRNNNLKNVLDIGTGSGCLACSIAKYTDAVVLGIDISSDALRVALDNVSTLNLNNRAVFRKSDLFNKIHDNEKFDIIVSNPPYISKDTQLEEEVLKEPHIALFADENGYEFYRKIIQSAPSYLKRGGYLMFELGLGEALNVKKMLEHDFTDITIKKDLAGIERLIYAKYQ